MARQATAVVLLAVLVALGGCLGTTQSTPDTSEQGCGVDSLAFWSVGDYHEWSADELRIGYELSGGADALLVAYENDTRLGEVHVSSTRAVAADGAPLPLDRELDGNHTVRVVAYEDVDGDGEFDPETDTECSVETDPVTVDFSTLDENATGD